MSNLGKRFVRKGRGYKVYKDVGGGSGIGWENHGACVEIGSAPGPKWHIDSTSIFTLSSFRFCGLSFPIVLSIAPESTVFCLDVSLQACSFLLGWNFLSLAYLTGQVVRLHSCRAA